MFSSTYIRRLHRQYHLGHILGSAAVRARARLAPCQPRPSSPPVRTCRCVPIGASSCRLVRAGTAWYSCVPARTDSYRSVLAQVLGFECLIVFVAPNARFFAFPPRLFPRGFLSSASTVGAERRSRPFDHRTIARADFRVITPTPVRLSKSSGAHCAPSVLTGDVQRLRAQRRANLLPSRPNPRPQRQ